MRLLAKRLVANNGTDVDSLGNLGYLAHGRYTTEVLTPFPVNSITFGTDSCTFSETCPFVPPLNVPVLLKSHAATTTSLVAEQANFQPFDQLSGFSTTVPFILEFQLDSEDYYEFLLSYNTLNNYARVEIGYAAGVWGRLQVIYGSSNITMTSSLQLGSPVQLTFETSTVTLSQGGAFVSDTTAIQWTHGLTKVENSLTGTASYMRVKQPAPATVIMTLQFDRTEYVHNRTPRGIKMYIDDAASGVTVPADRPPALHSAIVNWDQYIPRFDPNFDLDRPYWKDRNTRLSEVLDLQRRREHICTLTNKATANFAGPKASFTAADGLPDEAWTLFGANGGGWELVSGQNVLNAEETALVADRRGTYELHFNIYHQTTKPIAFIVAGQSNARGWLQQGVAGDAHFSGTKQWSYGQYYNGTSWVDWQSTGLIDATLPLHHPDSRYSNAIGFDMQFSHEHGTSDVIFIPCAYGGSGFANNYWNKGDTITVNGVQTPGLYQQMVEKANAFFDAYPDVELAGFLWHQGEADAGSLANINNYADSFTTMLQHARNDIHAMTADTPVIIGAILETSAQPNAAAFNSELASIAANDSSITYVADLATLGAFFDGIHFNRDGYNAMGTLYYQAWLAAYQSKAVALAFQARVNATGVGPVYISKPASRFTRRAGQSGDQQVRLQLAAGDSVGVQVAIYTAGAGAYEAHAPAGRSMLALKRIV